MEAITNINYTPFILYLLGLIGVIVHNLVQLDKQNRAQNGELKLLKYWKMERFSIMISLIWLLGLTITSQEIEKIKNVGEYIGLAFIAFGYLGQSLLVFVMEKIRAKAKINQRQ